MQYFHDLQSSTESEEPEVLNTPKSVSAPPSNKLGIKAKTLFQDDTAVTATPKETPVATKPSLMVTDM